MRSPKSLLSSTAAMLLFGLCLAHASPIRPCTQQELVGTWEMVSVAPVLEPSNATFFPYQRFIFAPDGQMKYMTSMSPFTAEEGKAFEGLKPVTRYTLDADGMLVTTRTDVNVSDRAMCSFVVEDPSAEVLAQIPATRHTLLPRKGNVTLTYYDGQGQLLCQKVLRRA